MNLHLASVGVLTALLAAVAPAPGQVPSAPGLLWVDVAGRPNRQARQALAILDEAAADALVPADYESVELRQRGQALGGPQPPAQEVAARFDAALTASMQRYLRHLRYGRMESRSLGLALPPRAGRDDLPAMLREYLDRDGLVELVERMRPPYAEYAALRGALPRYRALVSTGGGEPLSAAAQRVRKIELAMERLRWLPDLGDGRLIMLNIPTFQLQAWDHGPTGAPDLTMKVIVGRAAASPTPVLNATMATVIFRPYWNVPSSILRKELLPVLRKDPGYLRRENMELVRGGEEDAVPVEPTPEQLVLLERGVLRLRQRPGPRNALGLVKFVLPNEEQVFLHGTPAQRLFARSRRDFSHGCVRVEDPAGLAAWVLAGEREWGPTRIQAAMLDEAHVSRKIRVSPPVQVVLLYTTATVLPGSGEVLFVEDIYKLDGALDAALARARR
ncbi:MAG: L,D-transpeptidase family protein [Vicinamibacterales bacterium]|nr:L,D-transpeptidase family protein [Vicinamibacterales bacterium]